MNYLTPVLALQLCLAAATTAIAAAPTDRPWEALQCSAPNARDAEDFAIYMEARARAARDHLARCASPSTTNPSPPTSVTAELPLMEKECIRHLLDKGTGPKTAKASCEEVRAPELACLKDLMERGYGPKTARKTCFKNEAPKPSEKIDTGSEP